MIFTYKVNKGNKLTRIEPNQKKLFLKREVLSSGVEKIHKIIDQEAILCLIRLSLMAVYPKRIYLFYSWLPTSLHIFLVLFLR